jgi:hypothetical protein
MRRAKRALVDAKKQFTIREQRELVSVVQVKPRMLAADRRPAASRPVLLLMAGPPAAQSR